MNARRNDDANNTILAVVAPLLSQIVNVRQIEYGCLKQRYEVWSYHNKEEAIMAVAKIAISLEEDILVELDRLVRRHIFPSRSRAIQEAVKEKVTRLSVNRLAAECAKLDPKAEQALAEEGMSKEVATWPEY